MTKWLWLPGGYIARNAATLLAAMPRAQPQQPAKPLSAAVQWMSRPKQVFNDAESSHMQIDSSSAILSERLSWDMQCYVHIRLKFFPGPGTAESGAMVLDPVEDDIPCTTGAAVSVKSASGSTAAYEATEQQSRSHREAESLDDDAVGAVPQQAQHTKGVQVSSKHSLLGFVTTGEARGLLGGKRGALAVVRADRLWTVRARGADSGGHLRKGAAIRVLVKNPRSTVAHKADAFVLLESLEGCCSFI